MANAALSYRQGADCGLQCLHGEMAHNATVCVCLPGWVTVECNVECSQHGRIEGATGRCRCDEGWRGADCDVPGCPGERRVKRTDTSDVALRHT